MKSLFFLALLALAVTSAVARTDTTCSQSYGEQSQQQQQLLINLGRAYLQQCTPRTVPFTYATGEQASSCQVMRQQFCQQLAQIPEQFRCQAVNGVAQAIMQQQQQQQQQSQGSYQREEQAHFHIMMAALHTLPQMCAVYVPPYCIISTTSPCRIAKAATSAGGAFY
ncbi:avenin-like a4 [Brachypodium distachyon]|uniref:Bifunctional inhibitor/plant lipid transfer protein/seed storage helical domain-containing protein n=1 Tax=Brachypodium distachyon TaxID=15368 RepID=I1H1B8_BRADI|nr:avenin-like a4 [Brachypodium distachyon]KQK19744.1 hypothetical protein BRADI_1g50200v3 [Brachypodium distachyon]|eukprot:XP_014751864.1 avenin-like a4 [Brachypodium distachyon]